MLHRLIPTALVCLTISGCAGLGRPVPAEIETVPGNDVQLSEVMRNPDEFVGTRVRWGGTVLRAEPHERYLRVEILQRPLVEGGKPAVDVASDGRFIARISPPPEDTKRFRRGRYITVAGVLSEPVTLTLAENRQQKVPLVDATAYYTWNRRMDYNERDDYYYYPPPPYYYYGNPRYWPYYWPYYHPFGQPPMVRQERPPEQRREK